MKSLPYLAVSWIAFLGCSDKPTFVERVYNKATNQIQIEIDYMDGMEPFTDEVGGKPVWEFYRNNIAALLHDTKTITVPMDLASMQKIPAQGKNYTVDEILSIAKTYRDEPVDDGTTLSIYIVFLDGYLVEEGAPSAAVIGASIGNTSVIAVFKPLIQSARGGVATQRFVEQNVLIHETGHALGLVNNGIEITSDHHDEAHGAHCQNSKCVMYFLNEGIKDVVEFAESGMSVEEILFGEECLQDASAALGLSD